MPIWRQKEILDELEYYVFDNLDKGFYKLRFNYDSELYDLSLRYAIEDTNIDSDAYKIAEGLAEITNKHDPYSHDGIDLYSNTEVSNLDLGLINRKPFGMIVKKYITKGSLVAVTGRIQTGSYEKDGRTIYTTDVVADNVQFLETKAQSANRDNVSISDFESNDSANAGSDMSDEVFANFGDSIEISDDDIAF